MGTSSGLRTSDSEEKFKGNRHVRQRALGIGGNAGPRRDGSRVGGATRQLMREVALMKAPTLWTAALVIILRSN